MTRDELLSRVMPELPGCPVPMVMSTAQEVLEDFCDRTRAWQATLDTVPMRAGQGVIELELPTGTRLIAIRAVTQSGRPVSPRSRRQLNIEHPGWESATGQYVQHFLLDMATNEVRVFPIPSQDGDALQFDVDLAPFGVLTILPDEVMRRHSQAIISGIKGRLMIKPKKAWTQPDMAGIYLAEYERKVAEAVAGQVVGGVVGDLVIQPHPFGGVYLR